MVLCMHNDVESSWIENAKQTTMFEMNEYELYSRGRRL